MGDNGGVFIRGFFFAGLISILMLLSFSCWERQKHEISAPEIPAFMLFGYVRDIDSGLPLDGIKVALTMEESYDGGIFDASFTFTDSSGYYEFNQVYRGRYNIKAFRDVFPVYNKSAGVINYEDMQFDLEIPEVIRVVDGPFSLKGSKIRGITWAEGKLYFLASVGFAGALREIFYMAPSAYISTGFLSNNSSLSALAFHDSLLWVSAVETDTIKSGPSIVTKTLNKLISINPATGLIETKLKTGIKARALTVMKGNIIAVDEQGGNLAVIDGVKFEVIKTCNLPENVSSIYGVAWDGLNLWASDVENERVYKMDLDSEIKIVATYVPFYEDNIFYELSYLAFDSMDNLWGVQGIKLYKFRVY
ncbi:MAG: hypothetical protein ACE5QV_04780 [Fidelibacterota bacterium]